MSCRHVRLIAPLAVVSGCMCLAQESAPVGVVRGQVLEWSGTIKSGEIVFRNAENLVFQCSFDEHSYFERSNERITAAALAHGDRIEVVADRKEGSGICYARTVQAIDTAPVRHPASGPRARASTFRSATDLFAPRGNMTFSGVILRISSESLVLRTRENEHKTILLRTDTRYLGDGQSLERGNLPINTRVFIRAGKNYDDEVEAYQVVWGDIMEPVVTPRRY